MEQIYDEKGKVVDPKVISFFMDSTGILIKYVINKKSSVIGSNLKLIADSIKKNVEFKSLIDKIKKQLKSENPNWALLQILKNKVRTMVSNFQK